MQEAVGSGKVMITMYSDDTKEEVLDAFTGSYNGTTETVAGESNGQWGQLETGRIVESPLAPSMSVLRMSGPMVTIAAQTPYDYTTFELDGGGFFSEGALDSEGGSPYQSRMFVMNGDMKSGDYQLHMKDGMNRRDIATMTFHWDRESKKLSLVGDNHRLTHLQVESLMMR
ncbi:hypothetical protein H6770_00200 [Candidatus Peribacteria bacterium]|nr:hypothetical protein [Candidatus Peribacteria bacterium]